MTIYSIRHSATGFYSQGGCPPKFGSPANAKLWRGRAAVLKHLQLLERSGIPIAPFEIYEYKLPTASKIRDASDFLSSFRAEIDGSTPPQRPNEVFMDVFESELSL